MMRKFRSPIGVVWAWARKRLLRKVSRNRRAAFRALLQATCFRKLEPKRVLSVSASFAGNVLQLDYDGSLSNQATLDAVGSNFILDTDGNLGTIELTGAIADLHRIDVNGNNGFFLWKGDFSAAPFGSPDANGRSIDVTGLATVELLATFQVATNVRIEATNSVVVGGSAEIVGNIEITSASGSISDLASTSLSVSGLADLSAATIVLGDVSTDTIQFGDLQFQATGNVSIELDSAINLVDVNFANELFLSTSSTIEDDSATLSVNSSAQLFAQSGIKLADSLGEAVEVKDHAHFQSVTGDIVIGPSGNAIFGSLEFQTAGIVEIQEDDTTDLSGSSNAASLSLISSDAIQDDAAATLNVTGGATFEAGTSITLADAAANSLTVSGLAQFKAGSTLAIGPAGNAQFGSLQFSAVGSATIQEDDSTDLSGSSNAASLSLISSDAIQDDAAATLNVTGGATFEAGTNITLADAAANSLIVGSLAQFKAGSTLAIGPAGNAQFGSLQFSAVSSATIQEDDSTDLSGSSNAASLSLTSSDAIQDDAAATLNVTGGATFEAGTNITLADAAANSLMVGGLAQFKAGSTISIGPAGTAQFGSLQFSAVSSATIQEDDSTDLTGSSNAASLSLISSDAIQDDAAATLSVTGGATFEAGTNIILADAAVNSLTVGGLAQFKAGSTLAIGLAGIAQFGSLQFSAVSSATIQEDDSTDLTGSSNAVSLSLISSDAIQDDAAATLNVTGGATFEAGTNIILADAAANSLTVGGLAQFKAGSTLSIDPAGNAQFGSLQFSAVGSATIQEDDSTDLSGSSNAASLSLTSSDAIQDDAAATLNVTGGAAFEAGTSITLTDVAANSLTVGGLAQFKAGSTLAIGPAGNAQFGSLQFSAVGSANIQEDDSTDLSGSSNAASLSLISSDAIQDDAAATLNVTNGAAFEAGTNITLADAAANSLIVGGLAQFKAGSTLAIGPAGNAQFGSLQFSAVGSANIQEDDSTDLSGSSNAASLSLISSDAIQDDAAATLNVTGGATFEAGTNITLADAAANSLMVGGLAQFKAGSTLAIGPAGNAQFGSLQFSAVSSATIQEDDSTDLSGSSNAASLSLISSGAIQDDAAAMLNVTGGAAFEAGTNITLADAAANSLIVGELAQFKAGSTLAIDPAGNAQFGSLQFSAVSSATIQEDDSTDLSGSSNSASLSLASSGAIQDDAAATLNVTNGAVFEAGTSVTLNDVAANSLMVGGLAQFKAGSTMSIGPAGNAQFGSLQFSAVSSATIQEDDTSDLSGSSNAASLSLVSSGTIQDDAAATLNVTNGAAFEAGTSITLNDTAANSLMVGGLAQFKAGSTLAIGPAGNAQFGSLQFTTVGSANIQEDDSTDLSGASNAASLSLTSSDAIQDDAAATLNVTGDAVFEAGTSITLNDTAANSLIVGGLAQFKAGSTLAIGPAGNAQFGSLQFTTVGSANIQEDDSTDLSGASNAASLSLTSIGAIQDDAAATLNVTGGATFEAGTSITLADAVVNSLTVGGLAQFKAGSTLAIGPEGNAQFGSLQFLAVSSATIQEDDSTDLSGSSNAASLSLTSSSAIQDDAAATLNVTNGAAFEAGTNIILADAAANSLTVGGLAQFKAGSTLAIGPAGNAQFGSLQFTAVGSANIQEDDSTDLSGSSNAASLSLTSSGAIQDDAAAVLNVTNGAAFEAGTSITLNDVAANSLVLGGLAQFKAGSTISIGPAGNAQFGSLQFSAVGSATIQEDDSTDLSGSSNAASLSLTSSSAIQDDAAATLNVTNGAAFEAGTNIILADAAANSLTVGGLAQFKAGSTLAIGPAGNAQFGSLQFSALGSANIQEDDSTDLSGSSNAASLSLISSGAIQDDAAATLNVTGGATFEVGTNITLADAAANSLTVGGLAQFKAGSTVAIGPAGNAQFGSLQFSAVSSATIQEDDATDLSGSSNAASLSLVSSGTIQDDAAATLNVTNGAAFEAGTNIILADAAANSLTVGGLAQFKAGSTISIGPAGNAQFGSLQFSAVGSANIQEDDTTDLSGSSNAASLSLTSSDAIQDDASATLNITKGAAFEAGTNITLADAAANSLTVGGLAQFKAGSTLAIGPAGNAQFGSLQFSAVSSATIQEDDSTDLSGSSNAASLSLASSGAIQDDAAATLNVTGGAAFEAGANITLADAAANSLMVGGLAQFKAGSTLAIGPAGTAQFGLLQFSAVSSATIQEDDTTDLSGSSNAASLSLISSDAIQDDTSATLNVTGGAALEAGTNITLSDAATNSLMVGGLAQFKAGSTVAIGPAGNAQFGSLQFSAVSSATIQEDDTTDLSGASNAASLSLISSGSIQDDAAATLNVTNGAVFEAGANITLADAAANSLMVGGLAQFKAGSTLAIGPAGNAQFGSLQFTAVGSANIQEDDSTDLSGSSNAASLSLISSGAIQDDAAATLNVTGGAAFEAGTSINLNVAAANRLVIGGLAQFKAGSTLAIGSAGNTQFGSLQFTAVSSATIHEDDGTILTGTSSALQLLLEADGAISDATSTSINIQQSAVLRAATTLILADQNSDFFDVGGGVFVEAQGEISIGANGDASFGSIGLATPAAAYVREITSTQLDGISAGSLDVVSTDLITQSGIDTGAGTAFIEVNADAAFTTTLSNSSVLLLRSSTNPPALVSDGTIMDNRFDGDFTVTGVDTDLRWRNISTVASVGTIPVNLHDLQIEFPNADIELGARVLNLSGDLVLQSGGSIWDQGSQVTVAGNARVQAANNIELGNVVTESFAVSGKALFDGPNGIQLGSNGLIHLGSLQFQSNESVFVQADSSVSLEADSTAKQLVLETAGALSDLAGASLVILSDATFRSTLSSVLNDNISDVLEIGGLAEFKSDADLLVGQIGRADFGLLRFQIVGSATIYEDSDTRLEGSSTANQLQLVSTGAIEDNLGATLGIQNNSSLRADTHVQLNEHSSNRILVGGVFYVKAQSTIDVGGDGVAEFGAIQIDGGSTVQIEEDSDTEFDSISSALSLVLRSDGSISDRNNASVRIVQNLSLDSAGDIEMNDDLSNVLEVGGLIELQAASDLSIGGNGEANFGLLQFQANGAVYIQEDSTTNLTGVSEAASLELNSTGAILDDATTRVTVAGNGSFQAQQQILLNDDVGNLLDVGGTAKFEAGASLQIDSDGIATFGSLQLIVAGNAEVFEDDGTDFVGDSRIGESLALVSSGDIADDSTSLVIVHGDLRLESSGQIEINNNLTNQWSVGGFTQFQAATTLLVGKEGTSHFGSIRFIVGNNVTIYEDSDTEFWGESSSHSLALNSAGSIRDRLDVSVQILHDAKMKAGEAIVLNDGALDELRVGGLLTVEAQEAITIGALGKAHFGGLRFIAGDSVIVQEDDGIDLREVSSAGGALSLTSPDYIHDDQGAQVVVAQDATFIAGSNIELGENVANQLHVQGATSFRATDHVNVDAAGSVFFGSLQFNAGSDVEITEDDSTDLFGSSTSSRLVLKSFGDIGDQSGTVISVLGDASLSSIFKIELNDHTNDRFVVGGHADLRAPGIISLGPSGFTSIGSVSLETRTAVVQEDDDSLWNRIVTTNLQFSSGGFIKNLIENQVSVSGDTKLEASKFIHLGLVDLRNLNAVASGVGTLDFTQVSNSNPGSPTFLFQLSDLADEKGTEVLTDLSAFSNSSNYFLGKSSAQLLNEYSYQQNLGRNYGLFITTVGPLTVESILAEDPSVSGDRATERPNVYVQTLTGDLEVVGTITTRSSIDENGALVLIAADQLELMAGGELRTEQVADVQALQRILNTNLTANAYSYDELFGDLVTTKFLFPNNYPYLPSPITSKFHTIALSFGTVGEIGFEFVVQYGDASGDWPRGVVRTFSEAGDLVGSNVLQIGRGDVPILSHVQAAGEVATVVRNSASESDLYYYDVLYLTSHTTVDSTVVLRRSTDFFLFENGGATDLAAIVDTSFVRDSSQSLAGTSEPPGMPLPPDIEPFRFIELERTATILSEPAFSIQNSEYDDRRQVQQDEVEVAIYRVRFDDRNENGQVDDGEEPTADQILDLRQKRIMQESRDVKGPVAPSPSLIRQWQIEYEEDASKAAGAYVIIGTDRIRGPKVIGSFILRDGSLSGEVPSQDSQPMESAEKPAPEDGSLFVPGSTLEIELHDQDAQPSISVHSHTATLPPEVREIDSSASSEASVETIESADDPKANEALTSIAAGSVLWLQRFRARQAGVVEEVSFSRASRRIRGAK